MEIMLQCILNVFEEEERNHISQAEEAEEIEAFAGIVIGPLYFFFQGHICEDFTPAVQTVCIT